MIDALRKSKPSFVMGAITWLEDAFMEDPDGPLTYQAFEWGYGGSTVWLSQRAASTVTVEHHPEWFAEAIKTLEGWGISESVDLVLVPLANGYADYIDRFDDRSLDLVFVDGRQRADCLRAAKGKIRPGGVLVLDDSQRGQYQEASGPPPTARATARRTPESPKTTISLHFRLCFWSSTSGFGPLKREETPSPASSPEKKRLTAPPKEVFIR